MKSLPSTVTWLRKESVSASIVLSMNSFYNFKSDCCAPEEQNARIAKIHNIPYQVAYLILMIHSSIFPIIATILACNEGCHRLICTSGLELIIRTLFLKHQTIINALAMYIQQQKQ